MKLINVTFNLQYLVNFILFLKNLKRTFLYHFNASKQYNIQYNILKPQFINMIYITSGHKNCNDS